MSRHHKVVKRPSSAVENGQWDFFHKNLSRLKEYSDCSHTRGLCAVQLASVRGQGKGSSLLLLRKKYVSM